MESQIAAGSLHHVRRLRHDLSEISGRNNTAASPFIRASSPSLIHSARREDGELDSSSSERCGDSMVKISFDNIGSHFTSFNDIMIFIHLCNFRLISVAVTS